MPINTNSNGYTFGYAFVMTLLVAAILAGVAMFLKPRQDAELKLDKMKQILNAVAPINDKSKVKAEYESTIKEVVIDQTGKVVTDNAPAAFDLDLRKEYVKKKAGEPYNMPVYVYEKDGKKDFVIPLYGAGLWNAIWGYVALKDDFNTIDGATYGHAGETPGLGAEITKAWFQDQFKGRKFLNEKGEYEFRILKGRGNELEGKPHLVDGMSGATITGVGVDSMLRKGYQTYKTYFESMN